MTPELNTLHDNALNAATTIANTWARSGEEHVDFTLSLAEAYLHLRNSRGLPGKRICGAQIRLICGGWYDFEYPEESEYGPEDIAYSLCKVARMNGHNLSKFHAYSVAQHCVIGSHMAGHDTELAFEFLMHDAPEFVMGDMTTPLKQLCADFQLYYKRTEQDMARRYYLPFPMSKAAKEIDIRMFATEARDLMHVDQDTEEWEMLQGIEPYDIRVAEWKIEHAAHAWLDRFNELWPAHKARHQPMEAA